METLSETIWSLTRPSKQLNPHGVQWAIPNEVWKYLNEDDQKWIKAQNNVIHGSK